MKKSTLVSPIRIILINSRGSHNGNQRFKLPYPITKLTIPDKGVLIESMKKKVYNYMEVYEEFIGIKQVKEAHMRVIQAELDFVKAQELRRTVHKDLNELQNKLRDIRYDLERTSRGEDRYLDLIKQEITLVREERTAKEKFEEHESNERDCFNGLSNALRLSHEKERAQNEKTKYWSVIGSVLGATVGIIGTSINSRLKIRQMKQVLTESSQESTLLMQSRVLEALNRLNSGPSTSSTADDSNSNQGVAGDNINDRTMMEELFKVALEEFTSKSESLATNMINLQEGMDGLERRFRIDYLNYIDEKPKDDKQIYIASISCAIASGILVYFLLTR